MRYLLLVVITIFSFDISAQMEVDGQILFGNEWIDYEKVYTKIIIDKDGVYRVSRQELAENGIPVNDISFDKLHMWNFGEEVGFFIGPNDSYIEFYAEKNRTQLDNFLFNNEDEILNTRYSYVSDNAAYFVTWTNETNSLIFDETAPEYSSNTLSPEMFYIHKEEIIFNQTHYKPTLPGGDQVRFSSFVQSEGYGSGLKVTNNVSIPISHKSTANVTSQVYVRYGGNSGSHNAEIFIDNELMGVFPSSSDEVKYHNFELSSDLLGDSKVDVKVKGTVISNNAVNDKNIVSEAYVTYPRLFHMGGEDSYSISIAPSTSRRYIELEGYEGTEPPVIFDMGNSSRIKSILLENGKVAILVDPNIEENILHICNPSTGIFKPKDMKERSFISYADRTDAEFLMISSQGLRNQGSIDWVQEYADYRGSMIGGGHVTSLVNIDQLYDQFAYGVDRHFICMKNYVHWTEATYDDPKFLFIVGKGIEYPKIRIDSVYQTETEFQVPTWGNPGSDNLLMATKDSTVPIFPVGRLAAGDFNDVKNYLDKVKDHDLNVNNPSTIEGRKWQKNMLHLSGGDNLIQEGLFNNLEVMRDTIENNMYGAEVKTFRKKSTDPIEDATSEVIFEEIKNGVSIITFFGHASVGAFDFNLDNVINYENKGKYPLLMSLGCYSGNIHTSDGGISEKFVLEKDRGSIAFVAASGTAYIGVQNQFGKQFYSELGGKSYGKTIGEAFVRAIDEFSGFTTWNYVTFYQQLTYHGDPAVKLPNFRTPDYIPDATSVQTDPKFIDTYEENFEVCFDIVNLGKYITDSLDILIQHENPQGSIEFETTRRIVGFGNNENICVTVPINSTDLVGKNKFHVNVDSSNEIEEQPSSEAELNNKLRNQNGNEGHEFFILNNSAVPTFPEEFAIVNTENVKLIANTFNAFGAPQTYFLEIDTTILYNSPSLRKKEFNNIRSLIKWELDFNLQNKTVYYWRVGSINNSTNDVAWRESSFTYEPGQREGWSQDHYFQFLTNDFNNLEYVDSNRQMKYVDNVKEIKMDNGIASLAQVFVEYRINSQIWSKWKSSNAAINSGVTLTLFDPILGLPVVSTIEKPLWGSSHSSAPRTTYIQFPTTTIDERAHLMSVLRDSLPTDYVVCVNFVQLNPSNRYNIEEWAMDKNELGTSIFEILEERGAQRLDELQGLGPMPYTFVYENKKEDDKFKVLAEELTTDETAKISVLFQIKSLWDSGSLTTEKIGPAVSWDEIVWDSDIVEVDTTTIDVYGINNDGGEVILFNDIMTNSIDLSSVNVDEYPFIRLKFKSNDPAQTAPQLGLLRVYFEGMHDLSLSPDSYYTFHSEELNEGEILSLEIDISNITEKTSPVTQLEYTVVDESNVEVKYEQTVEELKANETKRSKLEIDTRGLKGEYVLQMQLNPNRNPKEKYYFNNFGLLSFGVKQDTINPVMDVTFDGVQIMNDDIVSSNPLIRMELDDNNPYLLLDDPTKFVISLTSPDQEPKQILVDDPVINFIPADSGDDNRAVIEYNPELLEDGRYLLSVQARDATGNASANLNYEVNFRVFNKEMVSNVFNYPNPFSTSTQFIFTLTGKEEPGNILIRILTLTGKVVREITAAELGNLRIGLNRTEYKWDGTDEFGEKLANGTYLYQVITKKIDGNDYDQFSDPNQNNTDHLFKEGFGKLVILR